jgi:hypothetical protein
LSLRRNSEFNILGRVLVIGRSTTWCYRAAGLADDQLLLTYISVSPGCWKTETIEMDCLLWGASKLVPIGYGFEYFIQSIQGSKKYIEDVFSMAYQQTEDEMEYALFGILSLIDMEGCCTFYKGELEKFVTGVDLKFSWSGTLDGQLHHPEDPAGHVEGLGELGQDRSGLLITAQHRGDHFQHRLHHSASFIYGLYIGFNKMYFFLFFL